MAVIELYRATDDRRWLGLAQAFLRQVLGVIEGLVGRPLDLRGRMRGGWHVRLLRQCVGHGIDLTDADVLVEPHVVANEILKDHTDRVAK